MTAVKRRGPGNRAGLTRDGILRAALSIVDRDGADALSMRRLGQELGVEAQSLYNHVTSKQALIDGVLELLLDQVTPYTDDGPWLDQLRLSLIDYRRVMKSHPRAFALTQQISLEDTGVWRSADHLLDRMAQGGLPLRARLRWWRALDAYVNGYLALELTQHAPLGPSDALAVRRPNASALIHADPDDMEEDFLIGLDHLLSAVKAAAAADPSGGGVE